MNGSKWKLFFESVFEFRLQFSPYYVLSLECSLVPIGSSIAQPSVSVNCLSKPRRIAIRSLGSKSRSCHVLLSTRIGGRFGGKTTTSFVVRCDASSNGRIRKLLGHFPRTYADLQNAQITINDGQYLIFIGKGSSSRGIKASCSLSFLEVIVGCEVAESGSASACTVSEKNNGSKRKIYLHLKKFFRGTRFTYQHFLYSLQEKQKPGDIVCVSGKVRSMRTKDHYEIRE